MMYRACSVSVIVLIVSVASAVVVPRQELVAQATDSTGMPSLELLAQEAGRASRRHPIRAVARAILCEPTHPLVDSASAAACVALDSARATAYTVAFARGLEVTLVDGHDLDPGTPLPVCPTDIDRASGPRVLLARVTAPVVGVNEGRWEGRLTLELRCRSADGSAGGIRTMGKEFLYQWSGRAWQLYQHSWLR